MGGAMPGATPRTAAGYVDRCAVDAIGSLRQTREPCRGKGIMVDV